MLIIWAVAIFGFQILLLILQKPTPEKAYITYESVWDKIIAGTANFDEKKDFAISLTAVLGKSTLKNEKREILANTLSWNIYSSLDSAKKEVLIKNVQELKTCNENLGKSTTDEGYLLAKEALVKCKMEILNMVAELYDLQPNSLEANIITYNLTNTDIQQLGESEKMAIPSIMKLYLIHNQSILTDKKFLGFPFHYFYTSEFLLILFVLLSLIYSMRIEHLQKKLNIVE